MQKSDLISTITGPHCKMNVGRGGVLGILNHALLCTTGTYTLGAGGVTSRGGVLIHIWGGRGVRQGRIAQSWGTHTSHSGGVWAGGPARPNEEGCVWTPQPERGICVCAHKSVCMWHKLGSVTEGDLQICSCMLPLVTGIVVMCCMADTNPECIVQWLAVHYIMLMNQYTPTLIWLKLCELMVICYSV